MRVVLVLPLLAVVLTSCLWTIPIPNRMSSTETLRVFEKAYEWFTFGARTRLMPGGRVAIIQTRWHMDDLTGRVTRDMAQNDSRDQYEIVEFPAILE